MTHSYHPSRWLILLLAGLIGLGALPSPLPAAECGAGILVCQADRNVCPTSALFGGIMDGIVGNRQRMIQFAFVGFGIGVLILVTATRKH